MLQIGVEQFACFGYLSWFFYLCKCFYFLVAGTNILIYITN